MPANPLHINRPLWPWALAAALLPLLGTVLATLLSMQHGLVPTCNPFIDGCTSISRAARHGDANTLFKLFMLPAAAVQGLVWWRLGQQLGSRWLRVLGLCAAAALVLYASFLGTEGALYRLLRQYGTVVYFGFTCINLLIAAAALHHRGLQGLAVGLVALGLANAIAAPLLEPAAKDRVENVTEWWGALVFVLGFLLLAWRGWRGRARLAGSSLNA